MPIMKEMYFLEEAEFVYALTSFIQDWTLNYEIKPSIVAQLNFRKMNPIIRYMSNKIKEVTDDSFHIQKGVETLIMHEGKIRLTPDSILMSKYADRLRICLPCVDNYANLVVLPSGNTVEEMRVDDMVIIEAIIRAKVKYSEQQHKKLQRKGVR